MSILTAVVAAAASYSRTGALGLAPDLVVTGLRWSDDGEQTFHTGNIPQGSNVVFEADVQNNGTAATTGGVILGVGFYVDGVRVSISDTHTSALAPTASVTLRANTGPDADKFWNNASPSEHTIRAWVDDENRFPTELNKSNNTLDLPVTVTSVQVVSNWTGHNANTGFSTETGYVDTAEAEVLALNGRAIRMGMDKLTGGTGPGGQFRVGDTINFSTRDAVVNSHLAAGLEIHGVVAALVFVDKGANDNEWYSNWEYFCQQVFAHYNNQVMYYILGNEGDLGGPRITVTQNVNLAARAKIARDAVNPAIVLENDPASSPETTWLRDSLNLGLSNSVDIIGVHNYGGQIDEPRLQQVWNHQKSANTNFGYPIKPVCSSESGARHTYPHPTGLSGYEYMAHWFALNRVQLKRFGYDHVLFYCVNSGGGILVEFDIADILTSSPYTVTRFQPAWNAVRDMSVDEGLRNAGFEAANDAFTDWVIVADLHNTSVQFPVEWGRVSFRTDGINARTGVGYLRLTCGASTFVRQVVEGLTPGQQYTITAHAKLSNSGPTATLRALGFNHRDGQQQVAASRTGGVGSYGALQVTFTPSKTWVVVNLEATGGTSSQVVYWDDVAIM